jgi:2-phospho-L-lactate guanylyltransferase
VTADWTVVVPVKGTSAAKSRLGATAGLARAIALDTVEAAVACARVVVVTPGDGAAFVELGATVVGDDGGGLGAAIDAGLRSVGAGAVAVLLGDLPALRPEELAVALDAAARHPRSLVPDADGVGTVLITALPGEVHRPAFGGASRAAHVAAGYTELALDAASGLRRDVDTAEQLGALAAEGRLGPRTTAALAVSRRS